MLARARPVSGWGTSKPGREKGIRADGLQGCPAPKLPGCRALQHATPGSREHWRGEHQQLPLLGNLCKKSLAAKQTACTCFSKSH